MERVNIQLPIFIDDLGMKFKIEIENSDIVFDSRNYDSNTKIDYNELKLKKLNNDNYKIIKFSAHNNGIIDNEVELIYNCYINDNLDDAILSIKDFMINRNFNKELISFYSNPNNYSINNTFSKTKKGIFLILKTKEGNYCCFIDDKEFEYKLEVKYKTCSIFFGLCSSYETYTFNNFKNTYVFDK